VLAAEGNGSVLAVDFVKFIDSDTNLRKAFEQGKVLHVIVVPIESSAKMTSPSGRFVCKSPQRERSLLTLTNQIDLEQAQHRSDIKPMGIS